MTIEQDETISESAMTHTARRIWAVVPAAGVGRRMQSAIPKQYLPLDGRPVIEHTLKALLASDHIHGVVVALGEDDEYWDDVQIHTHNGENKPILRAPGGKERANSVLNAIFVLLAETGDDLLWVMVHDAVRPCLRQEDIEKLVEQVGDDINGGILARPVRDTMKRQRSGSDTETSYCIDSTVDRTGLWHALTPQYFPARALFSAIESTLETDPDAITDEASAMEHAGYTPRLIEGYEDNIKITHPDDLRLASLYLDALKA